MKTDRVRIEDYGRSSPFSTVCFGAIRSGDVPTDKKFTGQRLDGTGLYYYGARYYDASIGRFISADTVVPDPMNPQALNRYSYVINNPLRYADPSGHKWFDSAEGGWPQGSSLELFTWKTKQALDIAVSKIVEKGNEVKQTAMDTLGVEKSEIIRPEPMLPPVPVTYVGDQGIIPGVFDKLDIVGISLGPLGIFVQTEGLTHQEREMRIKHESWHYWEQSLVGMVPWTVMYYREIGLRFLYYGDYGSAYRSSSGEVRARRYAGQPDPELEQPWWQRLWEEYLRYQAFLNEASGEHSIMPY